MNALRYYLAISTFLAAPVLIAEPMTTERFLKIAAAPGDNKPLNRELAHIPYWPKYRVTIDLKPESGEPTQERMTAHAKTVNGDYLVAWFYSPLYRQKLYSITAHSPTTRKYETWCLYGDTLVEAEFSLDITSRTTQGTCTLTLGKDVFKESTTGVYEPKKITERTTVTKNGAKFMTRTLTITPEE